MKSTALRLCKLGIAGILLSLTGCTALGPDFKNPEAEVEQQWLESDDSAIQAGDTATSDWWTVFNDPVLNTLVQRAYEQNLPLQVAGLRIMQARAQLGIAIGSQYPQVQEAAGSLNRVGLSENQPNFSSTLEENYWAANAGFNTSWEMDFWGKFRRGVESANANLGTQVAAYDNALVSLTGEVASVYTRIRTLEERIAVARDNIEVQQRGYRLTNIRYREGATSALDPAQSLTLLRNTQSQVPVLESQLRQAKNALSTLLGMPPRDLGDLLGAGKIPDAPAEVAVGVPAELLRRRPDIREAELRAAAQSAQIGVAEANLYPSFTLLGSIGYTTSNTGDSNMNDLFNADSLGYSLGPSFSWPILNYGRLKNNVRIQDARFEELIVNYQNTVLEAAREVEDSLAGFLGAKAATGYLNESVESAKRAVELSLIQYREGAVDYQRVLDSQQTLLEQQDQYTNAQGNVVLNLVATYKALGGGWQIRAGQEFLPQSRLERMQQRTDWGELIPGETQPDTLPELPATGMAQPLFDKPDW